MTLIIGFVLAHIGGLLGASLGVVGLLFGLNRHQAANAADSRAQQAEAKAAIATAQSEFDKANASVATQSEQAVANRVQADRQAHQGSDADVDAQLKQLGALREDKQ